MTALYLSMLLGQFGPITTDGITTTGTEVADAGNFATVCLLGSCITSWPSSSSSSSGGGGNQYFLDGGFQATKITVAPTGTGWPFTIADGINALAAGIDSIGADDGGNVFVTLGNGQSFTIWGDAGAQLVSVANTTTPTIAINAVPTFTQAPLTLGSGFAAIIERQDDSLSSGRPPWTWGTDSTGNWYWAGGGGSYIFRGDAGGVVQIDARGDISATGNIDAGGSVLVGNYLIEGWGYPWDVTFTSNNQPQDAGIDVIGSDTSGNLYETLGTGQKAEWWNDGGALVASIDYLGNANLRSVDAGSISTPGTILADGGIQGQTLTAGNLQADHRTYPLNPSAVYAGEYDFYEPNGYDYAQMVFTYAGYVQALAISSGIEFETSSYGTWFEIGLTGATSATNGQIIAQQEGWPWAMTNSIDVVSSAMGGGANGLNVVGQQANNTATENLVNPVFVGNLGNDAGFMGLWLALSNQDAGPNNGTLLSDGGWLAIDQTGAPVTVGGPMTLGTIDAGRYVNPAPTILVNSSSPTFAANTTIAAGIEPSGFKPMLVGLGGYIKTAGTGTAVVQLQVVDNGGNTCYAGISCAASAGEFSITTGLDGTCTFNAGAYYFLEFGAIDAGTSCTTNPTFLNLEAIAQVVHT